MTWDWRKVVSALFNGKQYLRPVCPVCHALLAPIPMTEDQGCKNGHRFGPDMKRVELINPGDHHGDL